MFKFPRSILVYILGHRCRSRSWGSGITFEWRWNVGVHAGAGAIYYPCYSLFTEKMPVDADPESCSVADINQEGNLAENGSISETSRADF